jgi:hypothetical protein
MKEPDLKEAGWAGEGTAFTTLIEEGEWVLRRSLPESVAIPLWISHYCGDEPWGAYSHRYEENWSTDDLGNNSWEIPCVKCGSIVPTGLIALYKMMRWGGGE